MISPEDVQLRSDLEAQLKVLESKLTELSQPNPFYGLTDMEATLKLSRMLMAYDKDLSDRYATLAESMRTKEEQRKAEVAAAGKEAEAAKTIKAMEIAGQLAAKSLDLEKARSKFTPGTPEYIDYLMKAKDALFEQIKLDPTLTPEDKRTIAARAKILEGEITKYELGKMLLGQNAPTPKGAEGITYSNFKKENPPTVSDNTGEFMFLPEIREKITDWVVERGGDQTQVESLVKSLEDDSKASREEKAAVLAKEQKLYDRTLTAQQLKEAVDKEIAENSMLIKSVQGLEKDPNDAAAKTFALTTLLRKESGAAIADSEYLNRMQGLLSSEDYSSLVAEMVSAKMIIAGRWAPEIKEAEETKIQNRFLGKIDGKELASIMKPMVRQAVWDNVNKTGGAGTGGATEEGAKAYFKAIGGEYIGFFKGKYMGKNKDGFSVTYEGTK